MTGPVGPTGDVYAGGAGFTLPGGKPAEYIFDNLDGSISGWDGTTASAQTMIAGRTGGNLAAYTGLEIDNYLGQNLLYAAKQHHRTYRRLQHVSRSGDAPRKLRRSWGQSQRFIAV